jgi:protein TonB
MVSPALPTVPHMPKDVPLAPADLPAAEPAKPGAIPIRIMLDSDGKVSGCTVTQSSGSDLWDAASCRIALARAHFTAARDAFDRPARGLYEAIADWTAMTIHPAQE